MPWETKVLRDIHWSVLAEYEEFAIKDVLLNPLKRHLIISEVKPTYTYGINSHKNDLLWSKDKLRKESVEVYRVKRGGKWTFHGPGQIIFFPIIRLSEFGYRSKQVRKYVLDLRTSVSNFLLTLGLQPEVKDNFPFGIYVSGKKLVSFGLGITHGVSYHGFSLYLTDQKRYFAGIIPCGCKEIEITSLNELGINLCWEEVSSLLSTHIKNSFNH